MTEKQLDDFIKRALLIRERLEKIHEVKCSKWIIGFGDVAALKASHLAGNTIDENTFLGIPYLIDYKDKHNLLIATNPLE